MNKALSFLKHEIKQMLPPTIYFFIVFHIVAFARSLLEADYGISIATTVSSTIGALIAGKVILLADATPAAHWFSRHKLLYNVHWRTCLYSMGVVLCLFLEELIPLLAKHESLETALSNLLAELSWRRFWASLILFAIFLSFYNAIIGIADSMGRDKFRKMVHSPRPM